MRVLWIYGTSCVGKSATAWQLYTGGQLAGGRIGFVDIDQLGMCYPASNDDPERDHLKARALHAMLRSLEQAPVDLLIVSGIMDPQHLDVYAGGEGVDFTFVRLRLQTTELERRCLIRWKSRDLVDAILEDARYLEAANLPHQVVEATGLTVPDVARAVLAASDLGAPVPDVPTTDSIALPTLPCPAGQVLIVSGSTPVGKSTVGFHAASALWQGGIKAGYLDLAQLDFARPHLAEGALVNNLLSVWRVFHEAGARRLIVSGSFDSPQHVDAFVEALAGCEVTVCRLDADEKALRERLLARSLPGGPELAGEALLGMSAVDREAVLRQSLAEADAWSGWRAGTVIDTSDQTLSDTLVQVLKAAGWMPKA